MLEPQRKNSVVLSEKSKRRKATTRRRHSRLTVSRRPVSRDSYSSSCVENSDSASIAFEPKENLVEKVDISISSSSESSSDQAFLPSEYTEAVKLDSCVLKEDKESERSPQIDPSSVLLVRSASLEAKAMKILERELLFEKLLAHSKSHLAMFEQQMNEFGSRYVAVRRSTGSVPTRKRVEIPDLPPSPILEETNVVSKKSQNQSLDEIDEDFTRVLKSSPQSNRPPLAPVPFGRHSISGSQNKLYMSKPLLANLPRRISLGKEN